MLSRQPQHLPRAPFICARWRIALTACLVFFSSACASSLQACGSAPASASQQTNSALSDPYSRRLQFENSVDAYRQALQRGDTQAVRAAVWNVCVSAQALAPYAREIASDIEPRFSNALNEVVAVTAQAARAQAQSHLSEPLITEAVQAFTTAMPRFWWTPAAKLRGRDQPGSPLRKHK